MLGGTIDDAAGEAFDKVARFLGLGYPGGPAIDRIAEEGDPTAFAFPRSLPGEGYDLSFSGLKTSVVNTVRKHPGASTADVAASFRQAVVDVLVTRSRRAAADVGARAICLAGGVAANALLRRQSRRSAPRTGSVRSYPVGPSAPTTRPWSAPPGGGGCATAVPARSPSAADPNLRLVPTG